MKKNIAIVMGGYSSEYDISIKSGTVVKKHLNSDKFACYGIIIKQNHWYYQDENGKSFIVNKDDFSIDIDGHKISFDCIFNAVHGTPGEDGLLQAYFELLQIPKLHVAHTKLPLLSINVIY